MITKTNAYASSDGTMHVSLEAAQVAELRKLIHDEHNTVQGAGALPADVVAEFISKHRVKIVDVLTTGPRSRPTRRKVNGASPLKRSRAAKVVVSDDFQTQAKPPKATADQAAAGIRQMRQAVDAAPAVHGAD